MKTTWRSTMSAAVGAAVLMTAAPAWACGGLFCDQNSGLVNQSAERIIFSDNPDDTVTSVVQILYNGPADEFSWVLPVPGVPEVGVSSNVAFQRLQQATNPFYQLNVTVNGECQPPPPSSGVDEAFDGSEEPSDPDNGNDGVTVVGQGSVGPYDYEVISVDPDLDDAAEVAVAWLDDNGYDVTAIGPDLLRPYLEDGLNLIAFRLQKDSESGSIRPVTLTYSDDHPMIPIKLTAVAADDDMGVMAFVLGEGRAVPSNYRHLILNEALINWFNPTSNYNDIINLAADESGGQGFVTEFAGDTESLGQVIFSDSDESQWASIAERDWSDDEGELLRQTSFTYAGWDGFRDALADNFAQVTLPDGATLPELLECIFCVYPFDVTDIEGFEPDDFITALENLVIEPMRETQALLDAQPKMTRLFSTLSAPEMTLDPGFFFNPDLSDVSNTHIAEQVIECNPEVGRNEAPWSITTSQGDVILGAGRTWPFDVEDGMLANREIQQLSEEGDGEVIADNSAMIEQAVGAHNQNFLENNDSDNDGIPDMDDEDNNLPGGGGGGVGPDEPSVSADGAEDGCGCTTPGGAAPQLPGGAMWPLLGLGLLWASRRRRDAR